MDERLDALDARARRLRGLAKALAVAGVCIAPAASLLWCGDAAANDEFTLYVAVPATLAPVLERAGAGVVQVGPALVRSGPPAVFGYIVPLLLASLWVIGRLVRPWPARLGLLMTSPFWLGSVVGMLPGGHAAHVPAARYGVIADRDGLPPAEIDGTGQHRVQPFYLRPERLPPHLADAARFVLAQQAYIDADPRKLGTALAGMSGAWRPVAHNERERLAIVSAYAIAHGQPVGAAAADARHPRARQLAACCTLLAGSLALVAGVGLDLAARGRARRGATLRARCDALAMTLSGAPVSGGLGLA